MKKRFSRQAAVMAAVAPFAFALSTAPVVAPEASAQDTNQVDQVAVTPATVKFEQTPDAPGRLIWRNAIEKYRNKGFNNVEEISAYSPSMDRHVPLLLIRPFDKAKRENAPTLYLLNGADGGEGSANWLHQTDIVEYYGGIDDPEKSLRKKAGGHDPSPGIGANIVIPMAGKFSYYTDWVEDAPSLGGKQMWETFLTKELPGPLEAALGANGKRAIAGMSMTGTTSLLYAQHNPGMYDAVGSFSGCAATTTGLAPAFIDITLNRGGANMQQMWGGPNTDTARDNDALLNAHKLKGQENIYVSNGNGLPGYMDMPWSPRVGGDLFASSTVMVEGGAIEGATNLCTHELKFKTDSLGIPVTYNLRPVGTHQWAYWQDDLRGFWGPVTKGLGTNVPQPAEPNGQPAATDIFGSL